jgi:hypothetical protein
LDAENIAVPTLFSAEARMQVHKSWLLRILSPITVLALFALASCDDEDPTKPDGLDFSGTYQLVSILPPGLPELEPPAATGTLTLTFTTFDVDVTIDLPDPQGQQIQDQGSYTIDGSTWSQESSATGDQSVGSYGYNGTRLELTTTTRGLTTFTVWSKTP